MCALAKKASLYFPSPQPKGNAMTTPNTQQRRDSNKNKKPSRKPQKTSSLPKTNPQNSKCQQPCLGEEKNCCSSCCLDGLVSFISSMVADFVFSVCPHVCWPMETSHRTVADMLLLVCVVLCLICCLLDFLAVLGFCFIPSMVAGTLFCCLGFCPVFYFVLVGGFFGRFHPKCGCRHV